MKLYPVRLAGFGTIIGLTAAFGLVGRSDYERAKAEEELWKIPTCVKYRGVVMLTEKPNEYRFDDLLGETFACQVVPLSKELRETIDQILEEKEKF